ncbi:15067_t:CDS:2 [Gigaspora margarita]|uniref:15067_t:CDS:1 n=1 Tax=Gigaspora margarita TaxID=4874 RepID=A0ABN7UKC8_GIGMA|nr:15067_t:CDS:2 [Gigaspora margarita]
MEEFLEFPKGYDFYIKSATSSLVSYSKLDRAKVIIAQQMNKRNNIEHDSYQLSRYEDGFLINKQSRLYLEPESVKAESSLIFEHRKIGSQAANQMWVLLMKGI